MIGDNQAAFRERKGHFAAGQPGHEVGPGARGIDQDVAVDFLHFARGRVGGFDADAAAVGLDDFRHPVADETQASLHLRGFHVEQAQAERID